MVPERRDDRHSTTTGQRVSLSIPPLEKFYVFVARVGGTENERNTIYLDACEVAHVDPFMKAGTPEEFAKKRPIPGCMVRIVVSDGKHGEIAGDRKPLRLEETKWYLLWLARGEQVDTERRGDQPGYPLWYDAATPFGDGRVCRIGAVDDLDEKQRNRLAFLFEIRGNRLE